MDIQLKDADNNSSIEIQYTKMVNVLDLILKTPMKEFRYVSIEQFYRKIFNVFNCCPHGKLDLLKTLCREYVQKICNLLAYPKLIIIRNVLSYFIRSDIKLKMWMNNKIRCSKINCRTLMELCINTLNKYNINIPMFIHTDIQYRIKNYHFS